MQVMIVQETTECNVNMIHKTPLPTPIQGNLIVPTSLSMNDKETIQNTDDIW